MTISHYRNWQITFFPNEKDKSKSYGAFMNGQWLYAPNRVEIERAVDARINELLNDIPFLKGLRA